MRLAEADTGDHAMNWTNHRKTARVLAQLVAASREWKNAWDAWIATGTAAGPKESKAIYDHMAKALKNAEEHMR